MANGILDRAMSIYENPVVNTAIGFTPVLGDIQSGAEAIRSAMKGNYGEAALNAVGLLPFVPALGGMARAADTPITQVMRQPDMATTPVTQAMRQADLLNNPNVTNFKNFEGVDYTPNTKEVKITELPRKRSIFHTTDGDVPVLSTRDTRMIPNSLSATAKSPDYVWGKNAFQLELPAGAKVAEVGSIFSVLPPGVQDTPMNIGKYLRQYADEIGVDALKIKSVHGVGTEYIVTNPQVVSRAVPFKR